EKAVGHARLKRVRRGLRDRRMHSLDALAVDKILDWHRIGFGDQVPDGVRVFVGLDVAERDDLKAGELHFAVEAKDDRADVGHFRPISAKDSSTSRARAMIDVNIIFRKPVPIEVKRQPSEQGHQRKQKPLLAGHTATGWTLRHEKYSNGF